MVSVYECVIRSNIPVKARKTTIAINVSEKAVDSLLLGLRELSVLGETIDVFL